MFRSLSDNNDSAENVRELNGAICRDTMLKQSTRRAILEPLCRLRAAEQVLPWDFAFRATRP